MVIILAITLYTTRAILSILGVQDYGIYNVVCGFVSMFSFLNTSMSNGIQRFYNFEYGRNKEEGANKVYNTAIIIQILLAIIVIILTETLGLWYINNKMVIPEPRLWVARMIFQLAILSLLLVIMQAPFVAATMAHERMDYYALVSIIDAILKLVIVFCLPYLHGDNLLIYGVLLAGISLLNFVAYLIYAKINFKEIYFTCSFDGKLFKSMMSFSGWNLFGSFSNMFKEQGLNLILNLFFGPIVNAARGVANQINAGLQHFVHNLTVPVRPQVIQSYAKGEIARTMSLTYSISKLSCCFLYLISLPIILEINYILKIWLGDNMPDHTAIFTIIIIMQSFFNNLNSCVSGVVHASGKMRLYQLSGCFVNLSALPLGYLALRLGASPEGALLINLIITIILQYVALIVLKTIVEFSLMEYMRVVLLPFALLIVITFPIALIPHVSMSNGFGRLTVVLLTSVISCLAVGYYIVLNKKERRLINQLVGNIVKKVSSK